MERITRFDRTCSKDIMLAEEFLKCYIAVLEKDPDCLLTSLEELSLEYIISVIEDTLKTGGIFLYARAENNDIVGFYKTHPRPAKKCSHVIENATLLVHPKYRGGMYGITFMKIISEEMPHIMYSIIYTFECKDTHIFHKRMGYKEVSKDLDYARLSDNSYTNCIGLCWNNPNYKKF